MSEERLAKPAAHVAPALSDAAVEDRCCGAEPNDQTRAAGIANLLFSGPGFGA